MNGSVTDLSVEIIVYDWNTEQLFKYNFMCCWPCISSQILANN